MTTWLLSAQTHPGWGAPVAVKRSPALFLACIARGSIWSGGGFAWPVLGVYWWWEILDWRQPERNTSGYFNLEIFGWPWTQHHTLFSFFPTTEWSTPLDSYYHLLTVDFLWSCLAPQPSEVQSVSLDHVEIWVWQKAGCLGEKSSNFWWYVNHSEIQLTPPLLLRNYVEGWIPTSFSAMFLFPSLVFILEEFSQSFRNNCGKTWRGGLSTSLWFCQILCFRVGELWRIPQTSWSLSRFKASPKPSPGFFFL